MAQIDTLHNAAALMLLLGQEESDSIFRQLPPEQAHQLRLAIDEVSRRAKPPAAGALDLDVNFDEFEDTASRQSRLLSDSGLYVRAMLDQAFGLRTFSSELGAHAGGPHGLDDAGFFEQVQAAPAHGAGLERLKSAELGTVVQMLVAEHPQVAAAILTLLELDMATRVLQNIPPRQRAEIVQRIARTQTIHAATLDALDELLVTLLDDSQARRSGAQSGPRRAAMLIGGMGAHMEASVLESIDHTDPALAQRILDKMDEELRP